MVCTKQALEWGEKREGAGEVSLLVMRSSHTYDDQISDSTHVKSGHMSVTASAGKAETAESVALIGLLPSPINQLQVQ